MTYHSAALASEVIGSIELSGDPLENAKEQWFVLQTNPRCEPKVAAALRERRYQFWLPTEKRRYRLKYRQTHREVSHPLLTGYLFVRMPKRGANWLTLRSIDGVKMVLGRNVERNTIVGISDAEIAALHRLCDSGALSKRQSSQRPFQVQELVRVTAGPFVGLNVRVDAYSSHEAVRVLVKLFGRLAPVEIALADLEAV